MLTEERLEELQKSNYSIMTETEAKMVLDIMHSSDIQNLAWTLVERKRDCKSIR